MIGRFINLPQYYNGISASGSDSTPIHFAATARLKVFRSVQFRERIENILHQRNLNKTTNRGWLRPKNLYAAAIFISLLVASCSNLFAQNSVHYTYDLLGRIAQISYPDGSTTRYSYDAAGNRTRVETLTPIPTIFLDPQAQQIGAGERLQLSASALGLAPLTYQWTRDGEDIAGATSANYVIAEAQPDDAGLYAVRVTGPGGSVVSTAAAVSVDSGRLINLSVRSTAGSGSNTLIVGFVVSGASEKELLVRGVGPTLDGFGVTGTLSDPILSLYGGTVQLNSNDDWGDSPDVTRIISASTNLGAFPLEANSRDAVILGSVDAGGYSAQVAGKDGTAGVALIELYDAAPDEPGKLINLSARTHAGTGANVLIVGFALTGTVPKTLLVRGIGPTLSDYGVTGVLADPQLELYPQGAASPTETNNDWGGSSALEAAFVATGAFMLNPSSNDAAMLVTIQPGNYSVQLSGVNGTTGIALVEVYEVP